MANITDEEWETLFDADFDTTSLLSAVDAVDDLRAGLGGDVGCARAQLRDDLLKLHQLAMAVFNQGARGRVAEMFELAVELDLQVSGMTTALEELRETLGRLTVLYPESLCYGGVDSEDVDV